MLKAFINGISYYLPTSNVDNENISAKHPEWSVEKIAKKTGISNRYIASEGQHVSDMAIEVAELFFKENGISKNDIDFILLCTQNPDYILPTTACIVQDKLNLPKSIGALDYNLGCSGYVYGLGLAKGLVCTGQAKNVLLITADVYSKIINENDKSNKTLFGDASTATLVSSTPSLNQDSFEILEFCYGTDGSGFDNLIVKNSGTRKYSNETQDFYDESGGFLHNDSNLYMDGTKIFNFTSFNVPPMIKNTLNKNSIKDEDISHYIFHQANAFMLDFIRKRCGINETKFFVSMKDTGNTVSSSIPLALKKLLLREVKKSNILLCGFGVGLSIGGVVIKHYEK